VSPRRLETHVGHPEGVGRAVRILQPVGVSPRGLVRECAEPRPALDHARAVALEPRYRGLHERVDLVGIADDAGGVVRAGPLRGSARISGNDHRQRQRRWKRYVGMGKNEVGWIEVGWNEVGIGR
jgi:hypothetical protein